VDQKKRLVSASRFFNEIRLSASEILFRNMKYAYEYAISASQMLRKANYFIFSAREIFHLKYEHIA